MRGPIRIPVHSSPPVPREVTPESDESKFINRPCYVFNSALQAQFNDRRCSHCRHYLTARCPHIEEFLDDVDDLSPE